MNNDAEILNDRMKAAGLADQKAKLKSMQPDEWQTIKADMETQLVHAQATFIYFNPLKC